MPPEAFLTNGRVAPVALPSAWREGLIWLAAAWGILFVLFAGDWITMADQWWNSSTYNHILFVPFILAWLVWQRLPELAKLSPTPWQPGLVLVAGSLLLWVLGAFAGFNLFRQAGVVAAMAACVPLLLGPRVSAGLLFPLAYMAFLVPFGDELVPPLQTVTAMLTIGLVQLFGVPATINGVFIDTPGGLFEVAESCSGVKFLVAMVALGVLVSNVCFRQWRRRALFMSLCVAVPIVANGIRAFSTIFAAQYIGAERAGGIDHIIYGWIFFALVIALILGASWRFFDRAIDDPIVNADKLLRAVWLNRLERQRIAPALALTLTAALAIGANGWAIAADRLLAPMPRQIDLPAVSGWTRVDYAPQVWWEPRATGADHRLLGRYRDAAGHEVDVFYALYATQADGREAGGFGDGALRPGSAWAWTSKGPAVADAHSDRLLANGRHARLALTYYRTGDLLSGSNARLKSAVIIDRLLLRERPTAMLILSAEGGGRWPPEQSLAAFSSSVGPMGTWMDRIAQLR